MDLAIRKRVRAFDIGDAGALFMLLAQAVFILAATSYFVNFDQATQSLHSFLVGLGWNALAVAAASVVPPFFIAVIVMGMPTGQLLTYMLLGRRRMEDPSYDWHERYMGLSYVLSGLSLLALFVLQCGLYVLMSKFHAVQWFNLARIVFIITLQSCICINWYRLQDARSTLEYRYNKKNNPDRYL